MAGGTFGLGAKSVFINRGTITVTGTVSVEAPELGATGSVFDNARGAITNEGSFKVVNGTFVEGAGTEVGAPIHVKEDGALDGPHDIVAIYTGDRHSLASTSKDYTQQVAADATTMHLQTGPETSSPPT